MKQNHVLLLGIGLVIAGLHGTEAWAAPESVSCTAYDVHGYRDRVVINCTPAAGGYTFFATATNNSFAPVVAAIAAHGVIQARVILITFDRAEYQRTGAHLIPGCNPSNCVEILDIALRPPVQTPG